MKVAIKIPLLAGPQEAAVLDSQSRIANWLYNKLLERANALRKQYREAQGQAPSLLKGGLVSRPVLPAGYPRGSQRD